MPRITNLVSALAVNFFLLLVSAQAQANAQTLAPDATEATITGSGTNGKIAKFTGAATIGNSIITEASGKIGIGTPGAPTARLHINGDQPADTAGDGTIASSLLRTSGGKGGKTTASGKRGGTGASLLLMAVNGGDAVAGATNGNGGSITLQPGSEGVGGVGGRDGNVLLAPLAGNVGIGVVLPESKLTVLGSSAESILRVDNNSSSTFGKAVFALSKGGTGVHGHSETGIGVAGVSNSHYAIFGRTDTETGYAGYFIGRVRITNGCMGCDPPSSRHLKANFSTVNPRLILERLATIPIQTWNYKSEPETVRHIGAMAQDFRAAFNLGTDDKTLNTVDAHGVTMAAIQGLYQMMREKDRQIEELTRQVREQQAQLNQVKRAIKRKRTTR
jgi:hypothetical protein